MSVKEIMRYGVTAVSPDESVSRVMQLMTRHRVRHMPVLRDGKLAGIISIGDVVKHRLEDLECETNAFLIPRQPSNPVAVCRGCLARPLRNRAFAPVNRRYRSGDAPPNFVAGKRNTSRLSIS